MKIRKRTTAGKGYLRNEIEMNWLAVLETVTLALGEITEDLSEGLLALGSGPSCG